MVFDSHLLSQIQTLSWSRSYSHTFNKNLLYLKQDTIRNIWLYYQGFDWNTIFETGIQRFRYDSFKELILTLWSH